MKPIDWIDRYDLPSGADPKKYLTAYATCVIDGYGWRISKSGQTYCSGKVKEVK